MCGRYTIVKPERIVVTFDPDDVCAELGRPRYNIAPMQDVPVVRDCDGNRVVENCRWGLVPHWAKDPDMGNRLINARSETAAGKPSFHSSFARYRCLMPADGFYEWQKTEGGKQPVYIRVNCGEMFAFAGLYSTWKKPDGEWLMSCVILTTQANDVMRPVHHRMPVILSRDLWDRWLDPKLTDVAAIREMLGRTDAGTLDMYPVSKSVNSPSNDNEHCIARLS